MKALIPVFYTLVWVAAAQAQSYKLETLQTPAPNLPAAYSAIIDSGGYRVTGPSGPWCEVWLRHSLPTIAKAADDAIVLPLAQGTLIGIFRFPVDGYDRRGQTVKAGVYTMRYSQYPIDGAHQGVAPQRDFVVLTPLTADPDPAAMPSFEALVEASEKGVGVPHPAVLSLEAPDAPGIPAIVKEGENDWVLKLKAGTLPIAILVVGKVEG